MTSSPYGSHAWGCKRATMAGTVGKRAREGNPIPKTGPSSDRSLQLDCVKSESLVKGHQQRSLEYVPGPCTHRPSHHGSRPHPKPPGQPAMGAGVEGGSGNWDEVVTR